MIEGYGDVFVLKVMSKVGKVLVRYRIDGVDEYRLLDMGNRFKVGDVGKFGIPKLDGNLATFGLNIDRSVVIYREDRGFDLDSELARLALLSPELYLEYLTYCAFYGSGLSKRERKFYGSEVRRVKRELGILDDGDVLDRSVTWETIVDREREIELDNAEEDEEVSDWVEGIHYRLEERTRLDLFSDEWVTEVIEVPIEREEVMGDSFGGEIDDDVADSLEDVEDFEALLEASWSNNNIYEKELEEELMRLEDYELDQELYGEEVRGQSRKKASKGKVRKERDFDEFDREFDGRKRNKFSKGKGMNGGTKRTHKVVNLVDDRYDGEDD